jgi:DNA polymerase I-like protein with 3'-5' exonuclease and polymerase domains
MYGMIVNTLAERLGISKKAARKIYDAFFKAMPKAAGWLINVEKKAQKNLYVDSPLFRRRHLWGYLQEYKWARGGSVSFKMNRLARNSPIQGFASDLNNIAASLFIDYIFKNGLAKYQLPDKDAWFVTNMTHDSTEFEVPIRDLERAIAIIEKIYTTMLEDYCDKVFGLKMPIHLEVDMEFGLSYSKMTKWDGSKKHLKVIRKQIRKDDRERRKKAA